ncbi:MAG: hypothetical protein U0800_17615 [Isosphaeraceae bacterium]
MPEPDRTGVAPRMNRPGRPAWPAVFALAFGLIPVMSARGEDPPATVTVEQLSRRLQALEEQNARLAEQNRALADRVGQLQDRLDNRPGAPPTPASVLPEPLVIGPATPDPPPVAAGPYGPFRPADIYPGPSQSAPPEARFRVGERDDDRGQFVLVRPHDAQKVPFELRADLFTQARFTDFGRSAPAWYDSAGNRLPIRNYQSTEITRNFVQFSGFALDPRLQFSAFIFSSTAINDTVYLGWINYHFSDAFDLRVGNWAVPGTREWYDSFRWTMGADRLMATTFFRPNISPGIWAQGEALPGVHYVAMLANSFNRFTQGVERAGSSLGYGGTIWWDVFRDYGPGPSDVESHETPAIKVGTNVAFSHELNQQIALGGLANPEDTILRLSDGTPLFRYGALGPGAQLGSTDIRLWTIDAGLKYRGLGLSAETFFRWLGNFQYAGEAAPIRGLFDTGVLVQGGYFLVPAKLEAFARTSFVTGRFGSGDEWGGGLNWYVRGTRDWRITAEVLRINHSPAQNILTGYRAGESGTLYQLQWFTDF